MLATLVEVLVDVLCLAMLLFVVLSVVCQIAVSPCQNKHVGVPIQNSLGVLSDLISSCLFDQLFFHHQLDLCIDHVQVALVVPISAESVLEA